MWLSDKQIKELAAAIADKGASIDAVCDKITSQDYRYNGKQVSLRKLKYEYYQLVAEPEIDIDEFLADC